MRLSPAKLKGNIERCSYSSKLVRNKVFLDGLEASCWRGFPAIVNVNFVAEEQ